jgi:tryptophan synthase alpha subunit
MIVLGSGYHVQSCLKWYKSIKHENKRDITYYYYYNIIVQLFGTSWVQVQRTESRKVKHLRSGSIEVKRLQLHRQTRAKA